MTIEERLDELERNVHSVAEVVAGTADDTLRVCIAMEELSNAGAIPEIPWDLATAMVELHHARFAKDNGGESTTDVPLEAQIEQIEARITELRTELVKRLTPREDALNE